MIHQRTLKAPVTASGVGLHSGDRIRLTLRPAPPDTGIVFRRTDLPEAADILCSPELVNDTRLSSTLVTPDGVRMLEPERLAQMAAG